MELMVYVDFLKEGKAGGAGQGRLEEGRRGQRGRGQGGREEKGDPLVADVKVRAGREGFEWGGVLGGLVFV